MDRFVTGERELNEPWSPATGAPPSTTDVLGLLRTYREAERQVRARTRESMHLGETDLVALQYLLRARELGVLVRQKQVAHALDISEAAASALVDRLERQGHVRRTPHPEDRRSFAVVFADENADEVGARLGAMHPGVRDVVDRLEDADRLVVARFLHDLADGVTVGSSQR